MKRTLVQAGHAPAIAAWTALVAVAFVWGMALGAERSIGLEAPPLYGVFELNVRAEALIAVAFGAALVYAAPLAARTLSWSRLLWAGMVGAGVWALALALAGGGAAIASPLESPASYLHDVPAVTSAGDFLTHFTERIDSYAVHVRSHPPGMVLALAGLESVGLGGAGPEAALVIAGGAATVPAALVALRDVAGEERARRAAPYLVLAPAALWIATTADALFAGIAAWAIALLVLATGRVGTRAAATAAGGGLLFGVALMLSYGVLALVAVPLAVAWARRRMMPLVVGALAATAVIGTFAALGFWWLDGLQATREQYEQSIARIRPYEYFLLANLAAFAVALGPATAAGLAKLRGPAWLLAGGALAAVAAANLSGLSKAEVERIWLPFMPWVMLATCGLPRAQARWWLAAQAALALTVQLGVRMPW